MSEQTTTSGGTADSTTTTTDPAVTLADRQAADLKAEREAQTKTPTKAERAYLESGTAPAREITPTTFGDGDQPPGGHPQDPTSKTSVGSKREL